MKTIQPISIVPQTLPHYDNEDNFIGHLNEYENSELRCQIAENQVEGYYMIVKDRQDVLSKVFFSKDGEFEGHLPFGTWDLNQRYFARIMDIRIKKINFKTI